MKQRGKKTIVCVLLCVLVCMVSAFALAGCKKTEAPKKYSVIFMNGDTQISEQTVEANKEAVKPADPTKESSVSTVYTFAGWALTADGEVVTDFTIKADTTFYAVYTPSTRKYTVKFMDGENQLSSADVDYDAQATKPADPTKAADAKYTYTFAGWALTADGDAVTDFKVTGDVTYYAVYTSVVNKYDVKFMLDGEQIGAPQNIDYDTAPTMPETPTKAATAEYTYTFAGWYTAAEGGEKVTDFTVKANATYYAHFTSTVNKYDVKFMSEGQQVGETQSVEYDAKATKPANPTKTGDAQYSYDFEGWYNAAEGGEKVEDFTVKGNATYYARYTRRVNKYTVKIIDGNGADLSETSMEYGSIVELPAPTEITGKYFVEWRDADDIVWKEDSTVKGNVTLHPFYKEYGLVVDESFYQRDKSDFTVTASEEAVPLGYKTVWTTFTTKNYIHGGSYSKIVLSNYAQVRFAIKTDGNFFLNGKSTNATHDWLFFELVQNEDLTWKTTVTNALGEVVYAPDNLSGARSDGGYVNQALNSILFGIPTGFYPQNPATDETMNIYFTEVRGTLKKSAVEGVKVDESVYNVNKLNMTKVTDYAVAGYETVMTYTHTGSNSIHGMNYSAVDLRGYSEIHFAFRSSYGFNFNNVVSSYDRDWMYFTLTQNDDETWNLTATKADGTVIATQNNLLANKAELGASYTPYALNAILYGIPSTGLYPNKSDSLSELTVWTTEIRGTLKAGA
ncbi:putative listeria/Bacterioides repeat-containing domain protein [Acidiphilium sp. CAG:727]|nr:putative listeria/Bacterioides repeat-containing domain protein [Acidiphilium sp. CAG:727]